MATVKATKMQIQYKNTVLAGEKQTYSYRTYSKVKSSATDEKIISTAQVLAGLQSLDVASINKMIDTELMAY